MRLVIYPLNLEEKRIKNRLLLFWNCSTAAYSPDLPTGNYTVKLNQKGGNRDYCYTEVRLNILGSNSAKILMR